MTKEEFSSIYWQHGNKVRLTNGKEYTVLTVAKRGLVLFSEEFQSSFFMTYHGIVERTSEIKRRRRVAVRKRTYEKV